MGGSWEVRSGTHRAVSRDDAITGLQGSAPTGAVDDMEAGPTRRGGALPATRPRPQDGNLRHPDGFISVLVSFSGAIG